MLTEAPPARQRIASPVLWALTSGITGAVANVLLVLSFLLGQPFGVNGPLAQAGQAFIWLGTANDVVIIVQFVTFIPVALALRRWLPPARSVQLATAAAIGAMVVVAILQLLLVAGVLAFDVQVVLVVATFLVVYAWVIAVSSTGHRSGTLLRSVTRFGLLLGVCFPVGLVIAAAGLLFPGGYCGPIGVDVAGQPDAGGIFGDGDGLPRLRRPRARQRTLPPFRASTLGHRIGRRAGATGGRTGRPGDPTGNTQYRRPVHRRIHRERHLTRPGDPRQAGSADRVHLRNESVA